MRICICGGGSQGHISAGVIGSRAGNVVDVLTRRPSLWSHYFTTVDLTGKEYKATLNVITDNPAEVIPYADIVYVCAPGNAIADILRKIKPFVTERSIIGSSFGGSGFFLQLFSIIGPRVKAFALQRVPYTGRPKEYGHSATLKGYKPYLKVATHNIADANAIASMIQDWYETPTYPMSHFLDATLSNSNPLLHPSRLYSLFKDWTPDTVYTRVPYFYNYEWDDASSECWLACDNEMRAIMERLPMMNAKEVPGLLEYYECADAKALTRKMQSIEPFKTVLVHMYEVEGGYKLDSDMRYFTEDIPYGMLMVKAFAELVGVETPIIDTVLEWAQKVMGKRYVANGRITPESFNGELAYLHPDNLKKSLEVTDKCRN